MASMANTNRHGMRILVISGEPDTRVPLREFFAARGIDMWEVDGAARGLELLRRRPLDVVVIGGDVLRTGDTQAVRDVLAFDEQVAVVAVVDVPDLGRAALEAGAYDFFLQPVDIARFDVVLRHVREGAEVRACGEVVQQVEGPARLGTLVTHTPCVILLFGTARRLARYENSVLISGESGTGKESLAREMHELGRGASPFVTLFAAGASPQDLEHVIAAAGDGTLYVDDVLALGPETAAALVTHLDHRGNGSTPAGGRLRIVAGCREDGGRRCGQGTLQEDLYLRLSEDTLHLPPLRDRPADVLPIAREILAISRSGGAPVDIEPEAAEVLRGYGWPGNVDELRTVVQAAAEAATGSTITAADLPPPLRHENVGVAAHIEGESRRLADIEAAHLRKALGETRGNKARAARILGLSRWALQRKLQKHHISMEELRS